MTKKTSNKQAVESDENTEKIILLPPLPDGYVAKVVDSSYKMEKTKKPPHYLEHTLLAMMDKVGIGTPATRATIIEELKKNDYISQTMVPHEKSFTFIAWIKKYFSEITNIEMTAEWEQALKQVEIDGDMRPLHNSIHDLINRMKAAFERAEPLPQYQSGEVPEGVGSKRKRAPKTAGTSQSDDEIKGTKTKSTSAKNNEKKNPPTEKMYAFAQKISKAKNIKLPAAAKNDFSICSEFINKNK